MEQGVAHELLHARVNGQRSSETDTARVEDPSARRPFPVRNVTAAVLFAAVPFDVALADGARQQDQSRRWLLNQARLLRRRVELVPARPGSVEVHLADGPR